MVIINSRQDQAKRIGYIYAAGLLLLFLLLKILKVDVSNSYLWFIAAGIIAVYSIITIPRKADGARLFYDANFKRLSEKSDILALGPGILKSSGKNNAMGALVLTKEYIEFRHLVMDGISDTAELSIELNSIERIEKKKGDCLLIRTENEESVFMVNKPDVWKREIYRARW